MDTTEQYIKMCDTPEIQGLFVDDGASFTIARGVGFPTWKTIWLPRQDQLQEMVCQTWEGCVLSIFDFARDYETSQFTSMEQLWLAFVMKEKHGKIWDGEVWVNV